MGTHSAARNSSTHHSSLITHHSRIGFSAWFLVVLLLAGCGLKTAYTYSDWLALWWIDQYFDLSQEQQQFVSTSLEGILARHRREALPKYERLLTQAQQKLERGLRSEDVDWFYASYEELRTELFEFFVEDGSQFLSSLDEQQIRYLEESLREDNERFEERLREEPGQRLEQRADSTVGWLGDWLGYLRDDQEKTIRDMSMALPDTLEPWLDYRRARQQYLLGLLRSSENGTEIREPLRAWLVRPELGAPDGYLEVQREMRAGVKDMALSIDRMVSQDQREHLVGEVQAVIDDLHELSSE